MVNFIMGPQEHHAVKSPEEYRAKQKATIEAKQAQGARYEIHIVGTPASCRIDQNSWIIDCECAAGNAVTPTWPEACCFGCGAIHTMLMWPPDREKIEGMLLKRPNPAHRNWRPGETLESLAAENRSIGADVL